MPDRREELVRKMVAEGTSDDDIRATLKVFDAQQPPAAPAGNLGRYAGYKMIGDAVSNAMPSVVNALPAIGGAIGGSLAGPAGAAAGGAAGAGYRQLAQHATEIPGAVRDVARNLVQQPVATAGGGTQGVNEGGADAGIQAAMQAGLQKAGDVVGAGVRRAGGYLMERAVNAADRLRREFPTIPQTLIDHSLTVSRGGLVEARNAIRAAKDTANAALQTAHANGATVPVTASTDGLRKTLQTVMESGDIEGGLRTLAAVERNVMGGRGAAMTPMEADALKRSLQTQSKSLYQAAKAGNGRPNVTIRAQAIADMAQSLNEAIGSITENAGASGYRAANAETRELIGAFRALDRAVARQTQPSTTLYQAGMNVAKSPANMSRLAIVLSKPSVQAMLKQAPRLATTLAQMMAEQEQP